MGDTHTAALVARDGSLDWLCLPRFDSPAIFAALLDDRGGHWSLTPTEQNVAVSRRYVEGSLVLETTFSTGSGTVAVTDCMPLERTLDVDDPTPIRSDNAFLRHVSCTEGTMEMHMELSPRFGYGHEEPRLRFRGDELWAEGEALAVVLRGSVDIELQGGTAASTFTLEAGDSRGFVLQIADAQGDALRPEDAEGTIQETAEFWLDWIERCRYRGRWRKEVTTSLLVLKGLTYSPTGGIVAAPTTSLPEDLGGVRNWDYRFCWLRDATFTLDVLLEQGFTGEAIEWRDWLLSSIRGNGGELQPLFGVGGETDTEEIELTWLSGYENSRPVRAGNAASKQFQLDVYGEILDAMHSARRAGLETSSEDWALEKRLVGQVLERWRDPDAGIWEVRGSQHNFVHSKVMAWVALDRAVRAVDHFGLGGDRDLWNRTRSEIERDIWDKGVNEERGTFQRSYEDPGLDAALLMLPMVGFVDAANEVMTNTIEAIESDLLDEGFVLRYLSNDGIPGDEGTFLLCTCWLVDNLAMIGRRDDALRYFERVLDVANDLGLLAEEYDARAHRLVGNFPQGFSHVAVITAAMAFETQGRTPILHRHETDT